MKKLLLTILASSVLSTPALADSTLTVTNSIQGETPGFGRQVTVDFIGANCKLIKNQHVQDKTSSSLTIPADTKYLQVFQFYAPETPDQGKYICSTLATTNCGTNKVIALPTSNTLNLAGTRAVNAPDYGITCSE